MKSFLKLIVIVPLALIAVAFAVANRQATTVSFDPFATDVPAFALTGPLFLVILVVVVTGVVLGGVGSWLGQGQVRKALRHANRDKDELSREVERLKTAIEIQARERSERVVPYAVLPSHNAA